MAPCVCFTAAVTPSEPLAPCPVGQGTSLPEPTVHTVGATVLRYSVKAAVVPDPSDRCTTWMPVLGRLAPELSALIAGSFHVLILPAKMPATVWPDSLRSVTPLTLYSTAMPPPVQGMCCTAPPLATAACSSSGFIGTSVAPKSTVRFVNCVMPAPDPTL